MTVDLSVPYDTGSLIQSERPTFYPVKIDEQHYQLKHRISTRDTDILYYCSSHEIYALHLKTRKKELVKSLAWAPCCLDAGYGWICAGGQKKGQCALIRIVGEQRTTGTDSPQQAEVDDQLTLDLDVGSRSLIHRGLQRANYPGSQRQKYVLHDYELGTDIVNSVTLYNMKGTRKGIDDEIILIVTNNDQTVRIFSLSQFKSLASLHYPTRMNHAAMTPDGSTLLAVGDKPQAFFHRRLCFDSVSTTGGKTFATYGWQPYAEPRLLQTPSDDACFSASFSPTGHVCAVASQGGVVTVFDTQGITADMEPGDAVICTFKTSRSSAWRGSCGAVRSLDFSPGPWDLLVWAEDRGQVSVIDLRDPPISKQTLTLTTVESEVSIADLEELSYTVEQRQTEIERRFLDSHRAALEAQDHLAAVTNTADYLSYAEARNRRALDESQSRREDLSQALTESEQRMLDSIGLRRPQNTDDEMSDTATAPISVNYPASSRFGGDGPYSTNLPSISPLTSTDPTYYPQNRSTASIAEYMRQRNLERSRPTERTHQPRRRTSIVISNSNSGGGLENQSTGNSTLAPANASAIPLSASPSRLSTSSNPAADTAVESLTNLEGPSSVSRTATNADGTDPWQTITDAFTSTYADPPHPSNATRTRRTHTPSRSSAAPPTDSSPSVFERLREQIGVRASPTLQQLMARNDRQRNLTTSEVQRLRQLQSAMAVQGRALPTALYEVLDAESQVVTPAQSREGGLPVVGVGWSTDGRKLYIGTEDGILEYSVNIRGRMQWPGETFQ